MTKIDLIPSRGAIAEPLLMEVMRDITPQDLQRLGEAPKVGVPILQKLRATHHKQAALLAQGKTLGEIAAIVGCTTQRLVQLQTDPTFQELVAYYHDQTMALMLQDAARIQDKLVDTGEMAIDELHRRLEDEDERKKMSTGNVRQIAEFAMDRSIAPPKVAASAAAPPAAITINFGTPLAEREAIKITEGTVIDGETSEE